MPSGSMEVIVQRPDFAPARTASRAASPLMALRRVASLSAAAINSSAPDRSVRRSAGVMLLALRAGPPLICTPSVRSR
ncbi:hypothetical protein D3C72_1985190 [compost metagenome]